MFQIAKLGPNDNVCTCSWLKVVLVRFITLVWVLCFFSVYLRVVVVCVISILSFCLSLLYRMSIFLFILV